MSMSTVGLSYSIRNVATVVGFCALTSLTAFADGPDGISGDESTGEGPGERIATPEAELRGNGSVLLDFEGLGNLEPIEGFYDGGSGGDGSGPGPDLGVTFSGNALAIIDSDAGGTGNFGGEPSPDTILFFLSGTAATMNVPAGFTDGFSFFYSAINNPGQIAVYDGLDATGNVLATLDLPLTEANGAPDPTGAFSPLVPVGVTFTGQAQSVDFGGTIDQIGFDNITLGSGTPIGSGPPPAPAIPVMAPWAVILLSAMLVGIAVWRLRQ